MRPFRSFLILLIFLCLFTGLYYVFPGNIPLPSIKDFIPASESFFAGSGDTVTIIREADSSFKHSTPLPDSLLFRKNDTLVSDSSAGDLSFPGVISGLFDSLCKAGSQVRIMYYGDSQIEGDRITSYLRSSLRTRYGGTGPGLFLPVMPVMYTKSVSIRSSSDWKRYSYLSYRDSTRSSDELGPMLSVCRYLEPGVVSQKEVEASVMISPSVFADSLVRQYEYLRIFYKCDGPVKVSVSANDGITVTDTLTAGTDVREYCCIPPAGKNLKITFRSRYSPDIFGISLESSNGVVVDNIPQRGSAGLEFTLADRENLRQSYELLKPSLIILHYGLNIVRNVTGNYRYYEEGLVRQVKLLNSTAPGALVLIVGVTDMGFSEGDSIRSFSNIPLIIEAQRSAASRTGAGFWDSREAMGGESSIILWAKKKSPLVQKDYVHFTYPGADTLSAKLVEGVFSWNDTSKTDTTGVAERKMPLVKLVTSADSIRSISPENKESIAFKIVRRIFSYDPSNTFIFTTAGFWLFLLVVLALYSIVYRRIHLRNFYLLIVSLYFYFKTGGLFLFLLVFVTVVDYICAILINGGKSRASRRFYLLLSLVSNLGLLAYFKYSAFIAESLNSLLGTDFKVFDLLSSLSNNLLGTSFDTSYIILPVGISFFTFQSLSYTIDVYRRRMEPVRNITDFGFYVSFFPHLVAGPIVRASVFMPQVKQEYNLSQREFSHALFMITKGLIKKIVISNFIAINFVDRVFDAPAIYSGFENLLAVYGYGLQIYCDFSGYTDIAIGVALLLGFRLPVNFNSPYKSVNITDFWRRWHISLSQWLKDYLYISLGGNRKGKIRTGINLMLTMLLGGLWHGASLRFIIWGGLHGLGLIFDRIFKALTGNRERGWILKITGIILTFHFVSFCWIFFRAGTADDAFIMLRQIFDNFSPGSWTVVLSAYSTVLTVMITGYIIHFLPESVKEAYRGLFISVPLIVQVSFVFLVGLVLYSLSTAEVMPFIYFRF